MTCATAPRSRPEGDQPGTTGATGGAPAVLDLADPGAADTAAAGAKAANLALARRAGLPVLPGFVITTAATGATASGGDPCTAAVHQAWKRLTAGGARSLVVRSSSVVEDAGSSSMAGQFRSVLGVKGWPAFRDAVADVVASAGDAAAARSGNAGAAPPGGRHGSAPMAVLVQWELDARCGGVLFGLDPASGDRRRIVVEVVDGNPHALVSGTVTAARLVLSRHGRRLEADPGVASPLPFRRRHELARLARRAERHFGQPQDVEWGYDAGGRLWLLQSRPVTATGDAGAGPVLGPGPVAETFPDPLAPLEADLWVEPLRRGLRDALRLTGTRSSRACASSPVVTLVGGRVAADLDLLGVGVRHTAKARFLDPRPAARQLAVAWRIGRLRAVLPGLAGALAAGADAHLRDVPELGRLSEAELLGVLERTPDELAALHAGEVLAGMLLKAAEPAPSAAGVALAALEQGRRAGQTDAHIVFAAPVTLSLVPPRVGEPHPLPPVALAEERPGRDPGRSVPTLADLEAREALRLRVRWVQELSARVGVEVGRRLAATGRIAVPEHVRLLTLAELRRVVAGDAAPAALAARAARPPSAPLPAAFRVTTAGAVVPLAGPPGAGRGASPGRAVGRVRHVDEAVAPGDVLVVRALEPKLAAVLGGLGGLVGETGSTLSHLAILAREAGVPTVVAVTGALERFPSGADVLVDGTTGEVSLVEEEAIR